MFRLALLLGLLPVLVKGQFLESDCLADTSINFCWVFIFFNLYPKTAWLTFFVLFFSADDIRDVSFTKLDQLCLLNCKFIARFTVNRRLPRLYSVTKFNRLIGSNIVVNDICLDLSCPLEVGYKFELEVPIDAAMIRITDDQGSSVFEAGCGFFVA